jgi:hypothetical protein
LIPNEKALVLSLKVSNTKIYSADGKLILTKEINTPSEMISVDVSTLVEGVYFLEVSTVSGSITKRFVKE